MPQGSHLSDAVVSARVVPARSAKGCADLAELAAAESWSPAPLEMVGFSLPESVRQARQRMLAQYRGRFHDVRLVAGMAGIGDIAHGEYVCDGVYDNLGRLNNAWYEKHGLRLDDSGACEFFSGKGEPLQVASAISFFGWENGNYAHWLSEKLGRFYWIEQADLPQDTVVLVEAGLPASIMDALALFWPRERTVCVQPGRACQVDVLHHFSDTADIWEPRAGYVYRGDEYHLYPPAIAWMASRVRTRCSALDGRDRAYLIRPPGGNGRTIVNQQELIRQLNGEGFQAFQPEVRDFASQVRALAGCELAILGSGAAAANLLWMPRGGTLVMLIQDNPQMWYWFFHALAAAVGVRLVYHPVKGLPGTHSVVYHWNVEIPIEALRQWLAQDAQRASQGLPEQPLGVATLQGELAGRRRRTLPEPLPAEPQEEGVDVTVAVMSYNNAEFLAQTIDSILAQEGVRLEVVVYDDCSKDDSLDVLKRYAGEPRLHFEVNAQNLGMTGNYNKCVAAGRGRYVVVLGSDDVLYPGHLASLVEAMDASPQAALGYTQCYWIDEKGVRQQYADHPGHRRASYCGGRDEVIDLLCFDNYITPSAAMLRRSSLHLVALPEGGIHRHDMLAGDWELWIRLAHVAPDFVFLRQPSVGYRVHGGQISKSFYGSDRPLREHTEILELCLDDAATRVRMRDAAQPIWQLYRQRIEAYSAEVRAPLQARIDAIRRALLEQSADDSVAQCLFSIILTTYNRPDLLKDALASVGTQTLRDFEVILINDNGEPVEHLLAVYDFPITYIRQGRNQGLSAARNAGLKQARGRYVVYLDDDDIYLPNHLVVLAEAFEQHPGSVIYTGVEYVNEKLENGQRIELGRGQPFKHEVFDRDRLFTQNYIPVNTWAHPRSMLGEVGEFDTGLAAFEDWDMLLRLATRYPFVHVPVVTSEVHTREQSTSDDHMLGRERKNFPALYQLLYQRYPGSDSEVLTRERGDMLQRLGISVDRGTDVPTLQRWLAERLPTKTENRLINQYLQEHDGGPLIGIIVLDLDGQSAPLMQTLKSLIGERCLYATLKIVVLTSSADVPKTSAGDKLHFVRLSDASLAAQINHVVSESDFSWFMLARAGDEFTPSGLMIAGLELAANPECRAIYGDQLQRLPDGSLGGAFLPSFNLDLLLSFPLVMARHWLFRRDVFLAVGGFDAQFAEALEFDLLTRLIEAQGLLGLGHVDEPLLITDAPALRDNPDERRVIERHLAQRGYQARVIPGLPARYRIDYGHSNTPLVSIIIAIDASLACLQRCLESLLEKTRYAHYEILFGAHDALDADTQVWLQGIAGLADARLRVVSAGDIVQAQNQAAMAAQGEYLLLLSAESVAVSEAWLDELLNHAQRPEVGVVGGKLLSGDGRIDQAGLLLGLRGPAGRAFAGEAMDSAGYLQRLQVDQNYSAVSDACLMVRAEIFRQLGGLDTTLNAYRDVDFCLRVRAAGYLTVWAAHAVLMHEHVYREPDVAEQDALYERHLADIARDPAYNRNLALSGRGFDLEVDSGLTWSPLSWRPLPVVLAHPADPFGCGNYRVIKPFSALKESGMADGMMSIGLLQVPDLERLDPDVIVLQRQIGDERLDAMRRIKKFSRAFTIYELDDYLPNLPLKSVHRPQMPKDILKSLRKGLSFVDRFTVSTAPLAEAFAGLHGDIRVVENRLPVDWWSGLSSMRRRGRKPRVGWAGGVSHTGDLELITDVVKELAGEVEWVFMGMCPEVIRPYVHEMHVGVAIDLYPAALASLDLDLALAPVEQNLFNECKSNLRLLEYGACGFPVICSDLVCYQGALPVTRVKNRFKDWVDAIRMHISDLDASARMGDELRRQVQHGWMLDGENLEVWRASWSPD
ncbi:glycosyltransferase [Pseudomonas sp.]|uniref:glycosyltransferase n=1 Tax=Pseudomonas sp. TaxID=306 RepID=UPI002736B2D4|nr:glycosyltransferase [Pseudomonas sp.]MDP2745264.1 glycosyltransferase [Pseudomonas sp.]